MVDTTEVKTAVLQAHAQEFEYAIELVGDVLATLTEMRVAMRRSETAEDHDHSWVNDELEVELAAHAMRKIESVAVTLSRHLASASDRAGVTALRAIESFAGLISERRANVNCHPLTDPAVRKQVYDLTGGTCTYCGVALPPDGAEHKRETFCVEHVIPVSQGGPNNLVNYVPSCIPCNSAKGDRHVLHFVRNVLPRRLNPTPIPLTIVKGEEGAA